MKQNKILTKALFGLYALVLIWVVMFKASFTIADVLALVKHVRINLIPFYRDGAFVLLNREMLLNVIIFVPLGLFARMLELSPQKTILYGFLVSLGFETCQILTRMGTFDTTDLITNTAGTVCGVIAYFFVRYVFRDKAVADRAINIIAVTAVVGFFALATVLLIFNR